MDKLLLGTNLSSFEGEAGPAPEGGANGSNQGIASPETIVYGKDVADDTADVDENASTGDAVEETPSQDPEEAFEALIKGDYKEQFDQRVQAIIDRRFKTAKMAEARLRQLDPVIDLLTERYGVEDVEQLAKKLEDESIEQLAYEKNMSPEAYRQMKQMERENKQFREWQARQQQEQKMQEQVQAWKEAEPAVKEVYPDFDLRAESQNDEFLQLITNGVPLKTAYEIVNHEKIIRDAQTVARKQTVKSIQAKGKRPKEAGAKGQSGVTVKADVKSLTPQDRAEIARRVARGERITF